MSNTDDGSTDGPDGPDGPDAADTRWWRPVIPNEVQQARYSDQLTLMINGLNAVLQSQNRGASAAVVAYPDPDNLEVTEFLYRSDTILVSSEPDDVAQVEAALGVTFAPGDESSDRVPRSVGWLRVLPLPPGQPWAGDDVTGTPAESALAQIEAVTGRSDLAGFDRVVHLSSSSGCPATEPEPAFAGPDPAVREDGLGEGVRVAVIDSGVPFADGERALDSRWSWLTGVAGDAEPDRGRNATQQLERGHYRGHGIFVAGVVRAMAPAAQVTVYSWGPTTYGQIESELAPILDDVLATQPHIINLSAGTGVTRQGTVGTPLRPPPSGRTRPNASFAPAIGLREFVRRLASTQTLLVCAAGNDGDEGPFEPASQVLPPSRALPCKVAVGALKKQGRLARYSNRGTWVDVYARGSKVVNAYPDGSYTYVESPRRLMSPTTVQFTTGLAQWSGTSFSTPLVAGLIAARMSWSHESPRRAWVSLRAIARTQAPYGLPTLRPGDADRQT